MSFSKANEFTRLLEILAEFRLLSNSTTGHVSDRCDIEGRRGTRRLERCVGFMSADLRYLQSFLNVDRPYAAVDHIYAGH